VGEGRSEAAPSPSGEDIREQWRFPIAALLASFPSHSPTLSLRGQSHNSFTSFHIFNLQV